MKVKKWIMILLCMMLIAAITGCGSEGTQGARGATTQTGVADVLQAGVDDDTQSAAADRDDDTQFSAKRNEENEASTLSATEGIDVDLTSLPSTMVYAEVYNMIYDPDSYVGKTIKMGGLFSAYHEESTGMDYFACIIQDATACCAQGIEFVLTDDYSYPADYPEEGGQITVVGVFDTYMEGEYRYCTLRDAVLGS